MLKFITNKNWWKNRKINFETHYWADHPHRNVIIQALKNIKFGSLIEIGCASGYNLHKIRENFPNVEIGGVDINADAIETAKKLLPLNTAVLEVSQANKLFLSDLSCDIILTDAVLIYIDPFNINKVIKEIKRVARTNILLVELHSKSWWTRLKVRLFDGYNMYNYHSLLKKHGFYNIEILKLSKNDWKGYPWEKYGYIISAKKL